jgi:ParB-like chromosome segregation protein Spo0J
MHWPNGRPANWQDRLTQLPPPALRPVVDAALADRANRALLARLTLSDAHRAALYGRGLSDEQIARHGYITAPVGEAARETFAAAVEREVGQALAGAVPAFVRQKNGRLTLALDDAELLIPVRDVAGRTVGIRRRRDDPSDGRKYLWSSWGHHPGGSIGQDGHTVSRM